MVNLVKYRKLYFAFSALVILAGIVAMVISVNTYSTRSILRLSIDFVGGSVFELEFAPVEGQTAGEISGNRLTEIFTTAGLNDIVTQRLVGQDNVRRWQVRTSFVGSNPALVTQLADALTAYGTSLNLAFNTQHFRENLSDVSPAIGSEVATAAVVATLVASLVVLGWIIFAFQKLKNSFRFGICALLAMLHDVLVMVGAMSILGLLIGWEADALFLTGLLTVVGYSVQDTIVIFDRVRENSSRFRNEPFEQIVNRSITETIQRSLMTQIAVGFVILAMFLIGGGPIHQFVGILFIGLLSGTYSSLFTAVPLLVAWNNGEFPFKMARRTKAA
jgi:preprotein translocase SecF subunit